MARMATDREPSLGGCEIFLIDRDTLPIADPRMFMGRSDLGPQRGEQV
jgi:hypothetical protein